MSNSNPPEKTSAMNNLALTIGIYLSILATGLLMILVFVPVSFEIQQVIVVIIGLLFFVSLSIFVNITNPKKEDNLLDNYQTYFDNRILNTYNYRDAYYNTHNEYKNKQNLADAAEEIKNLMDSLSKNYDESPVYKSSIDTDLLKRIETIEDKIHENFTEKEKIITAQVVETIEKNNTLKERLIEALKDGGDEVIKQFLYNLPYYGILKAVINSFLLDSLEKDNTEFTKNNGLN